MPFLFAPERNGRKKEGARCETRPTGSPQNSQNPPTTVGLEQSRREINPIIADVGYEQKKCAT